ncbi:hypothetical protein I6B53_05195 [Schaalia sp. 19OD2882]|uniref:hypothetical protein n=1 Tax=Schaalia sp. 19OD2882 TaxID=2794089 RepID=UPI001C1F04BB|nr:hypothetical protein [Schaalia sp. 19OD2882]QWW20464.1 hypothetical protein I6B53_05195 [Schaalia sp. 19OD2882]
MGADDWIRIAGWGLVLLLSAALGWVCTVLVLRCARVPAEAEPAPRRGADVTLHLPQRQPRSVKGGGTWVGVLERLAVSTCLLSGQAGLIAVVVAVKGLGRFAELRDDPAFAERFLIGTSTSMLSAVWITLAGQRLLDLVLHSPA